MVLEREALVDLVLDLVAGGPQTLLRSLTGEQPLDNDARFCLESAQLDPRLFSEDLETAAASVSCGHAAVGLVEIVVSAQKCFMVKVLDSTSIGHYMTGAVLIHCIADTVLVHDSAGLLSLQLQSGVSVKRLKTSAVLQLF